MRILSGLLSPDVVPPANSAHLLGNLAWFPACRMTHIALVLVPEPLGNDASGIVSRRV